MRPRWRSLTAVVGLCLVCACSRPSPSTTPPTTAPTVAVVVDPGEPTLEWTVSRAADPELVHLHVQAATAPGAFLVPWLEGVTLRPCSIVVHDGGAVVQDTRLSYDEDGRLEAVAVDGDTETLARDEDGRLQHARGFRYEWELDRLARLVEGDGASKRVHQLRYDDEGRLVAIETLVGDAVHRKHELRFDDRGLLAERRWTEPAGAHSESYYTYDERGRLVRVDVDTTDDTGNRRVDPALIIEYDDQRVTEFGRARVGYDDDGRVVRVGDNGVQAEYRYACGAAPERPSTAGDPATQ